MSYQNHNSYNRPLIDLIPDNLDVSDEEDAFYVHDEGDYLLNPKWREVITKTTNRVPRRIKRYFLIYVLCAFILLVSWIAYFGPQHALYKEEVKAMDNPAETTFGKNKRPEFGGMVQVKKMEEKFLPKGEGRLIVVGDVHGCREELEHLMRKVEFVEGRDHLVLTGDIIAKGKLRGQLHWISG
jgi:hypothetical protein